MPVEKTVDGKQRVREDSSQNDVREKRPHDDHREHSEDPKEQYEEDSFWSHCLPYLSLAYAACAAKTAITYVLVSTKPMSATKRSVSSPAPGHLFFHLSTLSSPPLYAAKAISGDFSFSSNEDQYWAPVRMFTAGS